VYRETLFGQLPGKAGDTLYGNFDTVAGVRGEALKFDGFTTKVVRKTHLYQGNIMTKCRCSI
jgi:hypothetical protein